MKKSRYTEQQIAFALKKAETGATQIRLNGSLRAERVPCVVIAGWLDAFRACAIQRLPSPHRSDPSQGTAAICTPSFLLTPTPDNAPPAISALRLRSSQY